MVKNDSCIWESSCQVCNILDLGMIERHVVGKAKAADDGNPFTKRLVSQQPSANRRCRANDGRVRVPSHTVADSSKAFAAGAHQGRQNRLDTVS
jgi:hypothetical protein